jgi:sugar O-acyltransferase (sialic acid O-acetyltransferase NeuD family)
MYLYGAGGHCSVVIDVIQKSNYEVIEGIFDDKLKVDDFLSIPVLRPPESFFFYDKNLFISIGNNFDRRKIANKILANYVVVIHPTSIIASHVFIQEGSVVMAGAILNTNVRVGSHCIINSGSVIEHDCVLENFVHVSPNASLAGNVLVGEGTHVGIGASIIQGVIIGKWAIIGAGSVVLNDVPDYAVIVGNPGRVIKFNSIGNE